MATKLQAAELGSTGFDFGSGNSSTPGDKDNNAGNYDTDTNGATYLIIYNDNSQYYDYACAAQYIKKYYTENAAVTETSVNVIGYSNISVNSLYTAVGTEKLAVYKNISICGVGSFTNDDIKAINHIYGCDLYIYESDAAKIKQISKISAVNGLCDTNRSTTGCVYKYLFDQYDVQHDNAITNEDILTYPLDVQMLNAFYAYDYSKKVNDRTNACNLYYAYIAKAVESGSFNVTVGVTTTLEGAPAYIKEQAAEINNIISNYPNSVYVNCIINGNEYSRKMLFIIYPFVLTDTVLEGLQTKYSGKYYGIVRGYFNGEGSVTLDIHKFNNSVTGTIDDNGEYTSGLVNDIFTAQLTNNKIDLSTIYKSYKDRGNIIMTDLINITEFTNLVADYCYAKVNASAVSNISAVKQATLNEKVDYYKSQVSAFFKNYQDSVSNWNLSKSIGTEIGSASDCKLTVTHKQFANIIKSGIL